jgi:hypothetical protein
VFQRPVFRPPELNGLEAAYGAALRAVHADANRLSCSSTSSSSSARSFVEFVDCHDAMRQDRLECTAMPNEALRGVYETLIERYRSLQKRVVED